MHNLNKITKILGATILLTGTSAVLAETLTVPATATVDNTIDFTLTGALDFGTLRATPGQTVSQCVGLLVPANPATAPSAADVTADEAAVYCSAGAAADGTITSVGGTITRPEFTVAGLAPFTALDVTVPVTADDITLALNPAPAGAAEFKLRDFTVYQSSGTATNVSIGSGTGTITADASGGIVFNVGATILTDATATTPDYQNTAYTGEFDVTVDFQ